MASSDGRQDGTHLHLHLHARMPCHMPAKILAGIGTYEKRAFVYVFMDIIDIKTYDYETKFRKQISKFRK
jgi:hypothetical protein